MPFSNATDVTEYVGLVLDPDVPLCLMDLDSLGVDLPHVRRPRGLLGQWDVARFVALPPALRAASMYPWVRSEIFNGGAEQLVWNQWAILPAIIKAAIHVGALGMADLLVELGTALSEQPSDSGDVVHDFLAFQSALAGRALASDVDPRTELGEALGRHALAHPDEFVLRDIEQRAWRCGDERFRARAFCRPDGNYEVAVDKWVTWGSFLGGREGEGWAELARDATLFDTEDAVRDALLAAEAAHSTPPTTLDFTIGSVGTWHDGQRLWPSFEVTALPIGAALTLTIERATGALETMRAHFRAEPETLSIGTRCRAYVIVDVDAASPDALSHVESGLGAHCRVVERPRE